MKTFLSLFFVLFGLPLHSQNQDSINVLNASHEQRTQEIAKRISAHYIAPAIAAKIDSALRSDTKSGIFNNLTKEAFAKSLTAYLRRVGNDQHFFVKYLPNYQANSPKPDSKRQQEQDRITNSLENFGFEEVRRLEGNVGYIKHTGFVEPASGERTLAAVMDFIANTNALILDLRSNGGGDNGMVLLWCSYFFANKTNLYETRFRAKNTTVQNWTQGTVRGAKYLGKPLTILTNKRTFSAAEALAYVLQSHQIATVVGEQTAGAANPVEPFIINNEYLLLIPVGEVRSTITKTNWEHRGVTPDEKTTSENALTQAHLLALRAVLAKKQRCELPETDLRELIQRLEGK